VSLLDIKNNSFSGGMGPTTHAQIIFAASCH